MSKDIIFNLFKTTPYYNKQGFKIHMGTFLYSQDNNHRYQVIDDQDLGVCIVEVVKDDTGNYIQAENSSIEKLTQEVASSLNHPSFSERWETEIIPMSKQTIKEDL
jgi:hypothetical protein